ncbi:MAG: sugar transferase [Prevotella sp.]|jgi:lipopolysaccharide/colanic/teichoic acid biosynthesis glycosyltransferase|nr:sugar transferase [Prevotella sp.]MCI1281165.1 sugar transferase [Prevotella sp.]
MAISDGMGKTQLMIKRATDIVCALIGMIVLSPLFLVIAMMLKMQRNGPVIFRQERVGKGGKAFTIYKFRTMTSEIEDKGPQLVATCDDINSTRLERFLRNHHLDELPQLWNVLKGDMSVVGPRPERRYFIDKIKAADNRIEQLYQMKPGLTSEATLYNGYTDTMEKMLHRLEMDLRYLQRRSLWLDFKITVKTAINIITGKKF